MTAGQKNDDNLFYSGCFSETITCKGNNCLLLNCTIELIDSESVTVFTISRIRECMETLDIIFNNDKEEKISIISDPYSNEILDIFLLREISVEASQTPSTQPMSSQVQTQSDLIKCLIPDCFVKCKKERMRQHIGQHLITNDIIPNPKNCGFCGLIGCSIALECTSGRGANKTFGPVSVDCKYRYNFSLKSAEKISAFNPCTNRPIKCEMCSLVVWSYNMKSHYSMAHSNNDLPEKYLLKDDEIKKLKALKFK